MEHYHTLESFVNDFYDENACQSRFTGSTEEELLEWQKNARGILSECIGLALLQKYYASQNFGLPQVQIQETYEGAEFNRYKIDLQIERNMTVPLYLFLPKDMKEEERRPIVLAPHGHQSNGKDAVAGIFGRFAEVDETIREHNYNYGEHFAKQGYIVLCPDAPGFGERRERWDQGDGKVLTSSCEMINHMVYSMGLSVRGIAVYNLMRVLDYALSLPQADKTRVYCTGLSGGGMQTLFLAACDERIQKAVISGYFYGVKESLLLMPENCACNFSHGLWNHFDMGDIACLIYPRAFLVETGDRDALNGRSGVDNVKSQIAIAQAAYALGGKQDRVEHHIYPGEHKWYGEHVDAFLRRRLDE